MSLNRKTLRSEAVFEGLGLHSGVPVRVTVHPAPDGGIKFRCGETTIAALAENVTDTRQCTRLGSISTIEHIMSALAGWEISDALVELTAPELPAMDGSARPFALGLAEAGFESLGEWDPPRLFKRAFLQEGEVKVAASSGQGIWSYRFVAEDRWPHIQDASFSFRDGSYLEEVAPARTFAFEEQVEPLRAAGFAKGLTEDSALILGPTGPLNSMRLNEEPARHKLLDLIGDLALCGIPLRGLNVVAERSGHRTNVETALKIRQILGLVPV